MCPLIVCTHEVAFSYCSVLRDQLQALLRTAAPSALVQSTWSGLSAGPVLRLSFCEGATESERSRIRKSAPHLLSTSHSEVNHTRTQPNPGKICCNHYLCSFFIMHFKRGEKALAYCVNIWTFENSNVIGNAFNSKQQPLSYLLVLFFCFCCCLIKV